MIEQESQDGPFSPSAPYRQVCLNSNVYDEDKLKKLYFCRRNASSVHTPIASRSSITDRPNAQDSVRYTSAKKQPRIPCHPNAGFPRFVKAPANTLFYRMPTCSSEGRFVYSPAIPTSTAFISHHAPSAQRSLLVVLELSSQQGLKKHLVSHIVSLDKVVVVTSLKGHERPRCVGHRFDLVDI